MVEVLKEKKLSRSEQKRQQIFDAAVVEFMENGFKAASMDAISARANVSKRTVYNHFPSKEILFDAIIERTLSEDSTFAIRFDATKDLRKQLKELSLAYLAAITNDDYIKLSRVVVSEFVRDHDAARKAFAQFNLHDQAVIDFIAEAMEAEQLRKADPSHASNQLLSLIKAFSYTPALFAGVKVPSKKRLTELVDDSIKMFLAHYGLRS